MIIYFSGTGNSKYIADALGDLLADETVDATKLIKAGQTGSFHSDKPYVLCFPSYLSTIPRIFADFICRATLSGNRRLYIVGTCAGSIGIAPNVVKTICDEKSMEYCGASHIVMPQNYIALFQMTPEDEIEKRQTNALTMVSSIAASIRQGDCLNMKMISKPEFWVTRLVEKMYIGPFTGTKKFRVTDQCIGCGLCEKNCPTNHIHMEDKHPVWKGSCIHCMACINRCPVCAIEYGKKTSGKKRYVCKTYKHVDQV